MDVSKHHKVMDFNGDTPHMSLMDAETQLCDLSVF